MTQPAQPSQAGRLGELATVIEWEGQLDNSRIRELLGVQKVWASRLLADLIELLGERARRPRKHGAVLVAASPSQRKKSSPDEYLRLLASAPGGLDADSLVQDARIDLTAIAPALFALVRLAAQRGAGLRITYFSMTTPEGSSRVVFPHAIVRAPRRWHMRAWCSVRQDFRDFVLARVKNAELVDDIAPHQRTADRSWNRVVDLVLVPHPRLNAAQQALIAAEYFPGARARRLKVREALAGYVLQDLRVASDVAAQPPPEYQLALAPHSEFRGFPAAE